MNKSIFKPIFIIVLSLVLSLTSTVYAHSGRTDSSGGHKDNKNASGLGSYHYHHGYEAHLHPNGICPYRNTSATVETTPNTEEPQQATPEYQLDQNIKVSVDGEEIIFDQLPIIIDGRVLVPIRNVAEKMNSTVEWDPVTRSVYINSSDIPLEMNGILGDEINVFVNNELIVFEDQQPAEINYRVLIPVRPVAEKLGYEVQWDSKSLEVLITKE